MWSLVRTPSKLPDSIRDRGQLCSDRGLLRARFEDSVAAIYRHVEREDVLAGSELLVSIHLGFFVLDPAIERRAELDGLARFECDLDRVAAAGDD